MPDEPNATENVPAFLSTTEEAVVTKPANTGGDLPPGWYKPQPEKLPQPTYWPAVFAFAVVLFAWGWVTNISVSAVGLVLFAIAVAGWIGDLRHES